MKLANAVFEKHRGKFNHIYFQLPESLRRTRDRSKAAKRRIRRGRLETALRINPSLKDKLAFQQSTNPEADLLTAAKEAIRAESCGVIKLEEHHIEMCRLHKALFKWKFHVKDGVESVERGEVDARTMLEDATKELDDKVFGECMNFARAMFAPPAEAITQLHRSRQFLQKCIKAFEMREEEKGEEKGSHTEEK
jgi:hypothetical protein